MCRRRHYYRYCIHIGKKARLISVTPHTEVLLYLSRALITRLDEAGKLHLFHVAENADVVESEAAGADDADSYRFGQIATPRPLPSTKRISSFTSGYISSSDSARCIAWDTLRSERKNNR